MGHSLVMVGVLILCTTVLVVPAADRLCSDHTHFSIAAFDELLNIPVETVFEHYFTDSALYRDFVAAMKMTGKLSCLCLLSGAI